MDAESWRPKAYDLGSVNLGDGTEGSLVKCLAAPEFGYIIGEPSFKQFGLFNNALAGYLASASKFGRWRRAREMFGGICVWNCENPSLFWRRLKISVKQPRLVRRVA